MTRARAIIHAHMSDKLPRPAPLPCESVEEFLARGGEIERLPTDWKEADHYPVVQDRIRART